MKRYPSTILSTAVIPWTENYTFDEQRFRRQIRDFVAGGTTHLYIFGTAGEGHAVTESQYREIVSSFADEMKSPDLHPMVGLLSMSLQTMHERLYTAYACGIRDFQFVLPSWGAVTDEELFAFFHAVCDPYPDCRFLHYNLGRSKRIVTYEEYKRLAEEIPNLVGAKYTTTDLTIIHKLASADCPLQFFMGELGFGYGSLIGECGLLSSISNISLTEAWTFYRAAVHRETEKTLQFMTQYHQVLNGIMGVMGTTYMDGAYDKVLARTMDPAFPLRLLPPYRSATEEQFEQFLGFLKDLLPDWEIPAARGARS